MFQQNISLKPYNTFGIEVKAARFISVSNLEELQVVISNEKDIFILSGGSNILLTKNVEKPVVHINLRGIEVLDSPREEDAVFVKAQAGENWHEFVQWCIDKKFGGIENLSLIPGNVGTGPMQNIGAYGVEIKDVFYELEALELATGKVLKFNHKNCEFGYRESIFKNREKDKFIIINVTFKLTKTNHIINTSYGAIQEALTEKNIVNPTIRDVSNAVITIRKSKLPDPKDIGNSGSFFKNPVISKEHFNWIQEKFPEVPNYFLNKGLVKVPAGWLVEKCGFKGKRFGDAGVHKNQALVLVNHDKATGIEILELAQSILKSVEEKFKIALETEVNII